MKRFAAMHDCPLLIVRARTAVVTAGRSAAAYAFLREADFAGTPFSDCRSQLSKNPNHFVVERVQRLLPDAHVVKAFNTVGNAFMFRPSFPGGPPDMFFCGNDADAKQKVATILKDFGWGIVDVGGIESSRYLEAMCLVWVLSAIQTNSWNQAFKLLKK